MGVVAGIGFNEFPEQSDCVGQRCEVCFNYDTSRMIGATILRYDKTAPGVDIFLLDDGRAVLSTECQHSLPKATK